MEIRDWSTDLDKKVESAMPDSYRSRGYVSSKQP